MGLLVGGVLLAAFVVTRSSVLVWLITPHVADHVDHDVEIGGAGIEGFHAIVLYDVVVRSNKHPGEPGEILSVSRARINTDLFGLLLGDSGDLEVTLVDPLFRVSEDRHDPGQFTFMTARESPTPTESDRHIVLNVKRGRIEVGLHDGQSFDLRGTLPVSGSLYNSVQEPDWFNFQLIETDPTGRPQTDEGLVVKGRMNLKTFETEGRIDGLEFAPRFKSVCPQIARLWWDRLDLDGKVRDVGVRLDATGSLWARIDVRDVGLTIPVMTEGIWSRYSDGRVYESRGLPRMRVASGAIELSEGQVVLHDLVGELASSAPDEQLAGVPYRVNGTIGPVPAIDWDDRSAWMAHALEDAPLDLSFFLEGFQLDGRSGGPNSAVELPLVVANILEKFTLSTCTLDSNVEIERTADGAAEGQDALRIHGSVALRDGRGAFERFPYPLTRVSADMAFTRDRVEVRSLLGEGPSGAHVSIAGEIEPPSGKPRIHLHISAQDVPLDEHLRGAMDDEFRDVIDSLMHVPAYDALAEAGALPDQRAIARAREERAELASRLAGLPESSFADDAGRLRLERRIAAFDRLIATGPFELGGRVDLELDVTRPEGPDKRTRTTGRIGIRRAGLVVDRFPYPLTITEGAIDLRTDGVSVREWRGVGAGGGVALIEGEIRTQHEGDDLDVFPNLRVGLMDDILNPALIEAIPLAGEHGDAGDTGALSQAADLLRAAGLSGLLTYDGRITTSAQGRPEWDIAVAFRDGVAVPDESMTGAMQSLGLFWPSGFTVDDVQGTFDVRRDRIRIASLSGRRGEGTIQASGEIDVRGDAPVTDINVSFVDFELEEYLLGLIPESGLERARELWRRYQPTGAFDAQLHYRRVGDDADQLTLEDSPRRVTLSFGEQAVSISGQGDSASLTLKPGSVSLDNLQLELQSAESLDGELTLSGTYGSGGDDDQLEIYGSLRQGRFESPWTREILRVLGSEDVLARYRSLDPKGRFNAVFQYEPSTGGAASRLDLRLSPLDASFSIEDRRIEATFERDTLIRVTHDRVHVERMAGQFASGGAFAVVGELAAHAASESVPEEPGVLNVSYRGRGDHQELYAFLPAALRDAFEAASLEIDQITLDRGRVALSPPSEHGGGAASIRSFNGTIGFRGAAFEAGLPFTDINGELDVSFQHGDDGRPHVQVDIRADTANARGWPLENAEAIVTLSEDGDIVLMPHFRADSCGGVVNAEASVEIGRNGRYHIDIEGIGIHFQEALAGLQAFEVSDVPKDEVDTTGTLYGGLSIEGVIGSPGARRGRGRLRIMNGRLANNPLTLPLIELSQLMLPIDASLSYGEVSFFIRDQLAVIERVFLEGDRLVLMGTGMVRLDDYDLDLRLRTRGRVVGLSDIVGGLNDQIYAIHVTGTLADPSPSIVPLPGLGGFHDEDWMDVEPTSPSRATAQESGE